MCFVRGLGVCSLIMWMWSRDYNAPTEGEKTLGDVSALPKPMQVGASVVAAAAAAAVAAVWHARHFCPLQLRRGKWGKIGQTKWTHLSNEDTTFKRYHSVLRARCKLFGDTSICSGAAPMWAAKEAVRSVLLGKTGASTNHATARARNTVTSSLMCNAFTPSLMLRCCTAAHTASSPCTFTLHAVAFDHDVTGGMKPIRAGAAGDNH